MTGLAVLFLIAIVLWAIDPAPDTNLPDPLLVDPPGSVAGNVGAFHLCAWAFTLTEAWAWGRAADHLVGHRAGSPWDDAGRRPSHADKRRAWRRELLGNEIRAVLRPGLTEPEIRAAEERLLSLAA